MSSNRREFLRTTAIAGGALGLGLGRPSPVGAQPSTEPAPNSGATATRAPRPLRILILGGTGFIGPHQVRYAQERGHTVTLFNRGKTNPEIFKDTKSVETIQGDRNGGLSALAGRKWDVVLDTSGYVPRLVRDAAVALKDVATRYVFISSVSVYRDMTKPLDEESPTAELPAGTDPTIEKVDEKTYGPLKVLCEREVQAAFGKRALIVRPGYIVGPRDKSDRFTYWPLRVARGGDVLAPGTAEDPVQVIDVRDLGDWLVTLMVQGDGGLFNAVGPRGVLTMGQLLAACKAVTKSDARFVWMGADALQAAGILDKIPIWVPPSDIGMSKVSTKRAVERGLTYRSLESTLRDTLAWFRTLPADRQAKLRAGLSPQEEATALLRVKKAGG